MKNGGAKLYMLVVIAPLMLGGCSAESMALFGGSGLLGMLAGGGGAMALQSIQEKKIAIVKWEQRRNDLVAKMTAAMQLHAQSQMNSNDFEGAMKTYDRQLELLEKIRPKYLIQKAVEKIGGN